MKKMIQREEKARELGRICKDIHERNSRSPVVKATVILSITGVTTIIETQNEMVKAATESNHHHQYKTEGIAFRTAPLLQEFGYFADNKDNVDEFLNGTYMIPTGTDQYPEEFIKALATPNSI